MRIDYQKVLPAAPQAMLQLEEVVHRSDLEPKLLELVKIRASQLNHCSHCLDMHTKDARSMGESEQRIHLLAAWREAPFYSERERAALAWCESLTLVSETGAPDDVYEEVSKHFSEEESVALTIAIVAINGWNRLAVGMRSPVGDYTPRRRPLKAPAVPAPDGLLDVRSLPPARRHQLIFESIDRLPAGQAITLVNDHDPLPLRYQLEATRPASFSWDYLEEGPETWRVRIGHRQ